MKLAACRNTVAGRRGQGERQLENGCPLQNRILFLPADGGCLDWVLEYSVDRGESWAEGGRIGYRPADPT